MTVGFIAEPINGSFQVVRIGGYEGSSTAVNFEIFSSKTRQWKDKTAVFNVPIRLFLGRLMYTFYHAVPCKRILHWMEFDDKIVAYDTSSSENDDETTIRSCRLINLPGGPEISDKATRGTIGVCEDHLRYCHVAEWFEGDNLRVWELIKSNNNKQEEERDFYCWSLLYSMRFDGISRSPLTEKVECLVAFHPFHPDIVYLEHRHITCFLSFLNLRSRVCKKLLTLKCGIDWWAVFPFVLPPWPTSVPQFILS